MTTRLELVTSGLLIERIADTLFMEMFPDEALAPILKGRDADAVIRDLRRLLAAIPSTSHPADDSLPALFDGALMTSKQRMRLARLIVDCLVEAGIQPARVLKALARFYTPPHARAPRHPPVRTEEARLHVV